MSAVLENNYIEIIGARENNLKGFNLKIPKNKFVVITGVSGSGKSSLAFDILFVEGQRRYLETLSAYARQFVGTFKRPNVDIIGGLSPVISIEQKKISKNSRSTVGTVTEIYDFLRLLYAKIGVPYSYNTGKKMVRFSEEEMINLINEKFSNQKISLLAPLVKSRKGHYKELFKEYLDKGYSRVRVDKEMFNLDYHFNLDRYSNHDIELQIDYLEVNPANKKRIESSIAHCLKIGKGTLLILNDNKKQVTTISKNIVCLDTGLSYDMPSPNTFSFNSPYGYCNKCKGLSFELALDKDKVIQDGQLSLMDGGFTVLKTFGNFIIQKDIIPLYKKHKVKTNTPIQNIPQNLLNEILFGVQKEKSDTINEKKFEPLNDYEEVLKYVQDNKKNSDFKGLEYYLLKSYQSNSLQEHFWAKNFLIPKTCNRCEGARLEKIGLWFKIGGHNIFELTKMSLTDLYDFINQIHTKLTDRENSIAKELLNEIKLRTKFICDIGLGYLSLSRLSGTLSGGESQRIRLATQISSRLQGITFILDEPSIGLHPRDNNNLIKALRDLQQMNNSIIVVEHDKDIMLQSDYIIDIGPEAGEEGGAIVFQGSPKEMLKSKTLTSQYLNGTRKIEIPKTKNNTKNKSIVIKGAFGNNLKGIDIEFPLGKFIVVTGVSGSGKSTLILETLYPLLAKKSGLISNSPLEYKSVEGLDNINKVIQIDQSSIGRTPRSNPATYCGFFNDIRLLFSQLPESKVRGYKPGRFSFNVKGGRCEDCLGGGYKTIKMNFLPDVEVLCPTCHGLRYNRETLDIVYNGKNINQILDMSVKQALFWFKNLPSIQRKLKTLEEVRLGYLKIGQSSLTISGGEAQRIKLATELSKRDTGKTVYILDEPTTGLHFQDIQFLVNVLYKLVDKENTVIVIEHNLDVIKLADYIIDLGQGGGEEGGTLVAAGTPENVLKNKQSLIGYYLKKEMEEIVNPNSN